MYNKLVNIVEKLGATRTEVWEVEMLYKYVHNRLSDPYSLQYITEKFEIPEYSFYTLFNKLNREAAQA